MAVSYKNTSLKSTNVRIKLNIAAFFSRILFATAWAISRQATKQLIKYLFFRPAAYALTQAQNALLDRAVPFDFQSGENRLQAYRWGKGPAVLFLHGWAGQGAQFHAHVSALIDRGMSAVTFDLPGHGRSQGKMANYFLFSNAVADFFKQCPDLDVRAIVAHSLGASAAINYMWRTGQKPLTILIAPALNLIEMLDLTFSRYGLPDYIFHSMIDEIGEQTGHTFSNENPVDLLKTLSHHITIVHDTGDRAVAYEDSWNAGVLSSNISLVPTKGLGHIRILEDETICDLVVKKIEASVCVADNDTENDRSAGNDLQSVERFA